MGRAGSYSRAPACSPGCTGSTAAAEQRTCVGPMVGTETGKIVGTGGHRIKKMENGGNWSRDNFVDEIAKVANGAHVGQGGHRERENGKHGWAPL